jgi:tetrahydromethanopterin S-methyltransferase subunit G
MNRLTEMRELDLRVAHQVSVMEQDLERLRSRLDDMDRSLRLMVGEVSQRTNEMLGLALATHHEAVVAGQRVAAQEAAGARVEIAEREAVFAANDAIRCELERLRTVVDRLCAQHGRELQTSTASLDQ